MLKCNIRAIYFYKVNFKKQMAAELVEVINTAVKQVEMNLQECLYNREK
jgi:hypothetical protein